MPIEPRNRQLKERVLAAPYEICIERARYYTQSFRETEGQAPALRAAAAFAHTLASMPVRIWDDERFVGNRCGKFVAAIIPVERGDINTVLEFELDALLGRARQPFHLSPEERRELEHEILPYWRGKTIRDRKKRLWKANGLRFMPAFNPVSLWKRRQGLDMARIKATAAAPGSRLSMLPQALNELLYNNPAMLMNVFDVQGHLIVGHKNILREGFRGVRERALAGLEQARQSGDAEGEAFLESVVMSCDAIRHFAERCADAAEKAAETAQEPRRTELLEIAARCRRVPFEPPRDFREAVQALWLTQAGAIVAYGMGILAVGRLDQHLYPYYARDKAEGRLSDAEAVAWVEELLIKLGTNLLALPHVGKQTGSELGSDSCSVTVGGVARDGGDGVNELSYLALEAFANIRSLGSSFMIRLSKKSPETFWNQTMAIHRATSGAALFCDEVVVEALRRCGMDEADARDYGVIGCVEPAGDGDSFACTSGNDLSLAAALEMTLLDGTLRIMGRRIGPRTGDPRRFSSFDEFFNAFERQVTFMIHTVAKATNLKDQAYIECGPSPYISATLTGCVEHARDMTAGGARYNFGSISGRGFGTAVNALAAIETLVYGEGAVSMERLLRALDTNFRNDEELRSLLLRQGPKYGCGDARADAIAKRLCAFFCREVAAQQTIRGGPFRPSFFSYGMHVLDGLLLGATPDGRRAGEPVSNSFSPVTGSETNGPTATLRSVAGNDHTQISNGCAVNLRLLPDLLKSDEGVAKAAGLVKGYFQLGGMEVQFNVVSTETLLDAQQHPERHRDLAVRVSGYSALFTDLGKPLQDEIIRRTQFGRT